jgi:hypothetical protein
MVMKKFEKVEWLQASGIEEKFSADELLSEIASVLDDRTFHEVYEHLLETFDWLDPKDYDREFP